MHGLVTNVSEACAFAKTWCGVSDDLSGKRLLPDVVVPEPIRDLHAVLGQLRRTRFDPSSPPFLERQSIRWVLSGQDHLVRPLEYIADTQGIVTIVEENQDAWLAGYHPDDPSALWVKGWQPSPDYDTWQKLDVPLADIVIWTLLNNLVMLAEQVDLEWIEDGPGPDAPILVWKSQAPPMDICEGFWTDKDRTVLFHKGYNFVARRRL